MTISLSPIDAHWRPTRPEYEVRLESADGRCFVVPRDRFLSWQTNLWAAVHALPLGDGTLAGMPVLPLPASAAGVRLALLVLDGALPPHIDADALAAAAALLQLWGAHRALDLLRVGGQSCETHPGCVRPRKMVQPEWWPSWCEQSSNVADDSDELPSVEIPAPFSRPLKPRPRHRALVPYIPNGAFIPRATV